MNKECFSIGGLVGAGALDYETAIAALLAAAELMPAYAGPWGDLEGKVRRAADDGVRHPREHPGDERQRQERARPEEPPTDGLIWYGDSPPTRNAARKRRRHSRRPIRRREDIRRRGSHGGNYRWWRIRWQARQADWRRLAARRGRRVGNRDARSCGHRRRGGDATQRQAGSKAQGAQATRACDSF
jgi:hypothetical protein